MVWVQELFDGRGSAWCAQKLLCFSHVAEEILEKLAQREGLRFVKGWKKRFVSAEGKVVAGYLQLGQVRDVLQC